MLADLLRKAIGHFGHAPLGYVVHPLGAVDVHAVLADRDGCGVPHMRARRHRDGIIVAVQARRGRERRVVTCNRGQGTRAISRRKPCFRRCMPVRSRMRAVRRRNVQRVRDRMGKAARARSDELAALALRGVSFTYVSLSMIGAGWLCALRRDACIGIDSARSDGHRAFSGGSRRLYSRRVVAGSGRSGSFRGRRRCGHGGRGGGAPRVIARRGDRRACARLTRRQIAARAIPRDGRIRLASDIAGTAVHASIMIRGGVERYIGRGGEGWRRRLSWMVRHQPRNRGHATDHACASRKRVRLTALPSRRAGRMAHAQWSRAGLAGRTRTSLDIGLLPQTLWIPAAQGADRVGTQAERAQHRGVQRLQFGTEADIGRQQRPFAAKRARYQLKWAKARHSYFADYECEWGCRHGLRLVLVRVFGLEAADDSRCERNARSRPGRGVGSRYRGRRLPTQRSDKS